MAAAQQAAAAELLAIRSRTAEEEKDVQGRFEHALEVTRRELRVATAAAEEAEALAARARADLAAETSEGKEREAGTGISCASAASTT